MVPLSGRIVDFCIDGSVLRLALPHVAAAVITSSRAALFLIGQLADEEGLSTVALRWTEVDRDVFQRNTSTSALLVDNLDEIVVIPSSSALGELAGTGRAVVSVFFVGCSLHIVVDSIVVVYICDTITFLMVEQVVVMVFGDLPAG